MTYKQAYDKIIDAYFKDEIRPLDANFCFCGTLSNNKSIWKMPLNNEISAAYRFYNAEEFERMEDALLNAIARPGTKKPHRIGIPSTDPTYEDLIFAGMSAALDVLKQIHIERGEVIDEVPVFTKRVLV